jgi:hypothetical protein
MNIPIKNELIDFRQQIEIGINKKLKLKTSTNKLSIML